MSLFYTIDKFTRDIIDECEFKNDIRKNIYKLWDIQDEKSVYTYASLKSLKCLKIIHETFLEFLDGLTETKFSLTFKQNPWEVCGDARRKPIHYVTEFNLSKQLLYLINTVNVDVNSMDIYGNTALHIICYMNHINLINILLYAGMEENQHFPNINIINMFNESPFLICLKNENVELLSILLKLNPVINTDYDLYDGQTNHRIVYLFTKCKLHRRNILRKRRRVHMKSYIIKEFVRKHYSTIESSKNISLYNLINIAESIGLNIGYDNNSFYNQITQSLITYTLKTRFIT